MAQKVDLQMGAPQCCFEGRGARVRHQAVAACLSVQPRVLTRRFILVAPAPDQGLAEAVFATELGEPFLAPNELAGHLQLELSAKVASQHRSAPLRWRRGRFPVWTCPPASPLRSPWLPFATP